MEFVVVLYVSILLEGRLEVLVNVGCDLSVISTIVLAESHQHLQVDQELLGKTLDNCSIM